MSSDEKDPRIAKRNLNLRDVPPLERAKTFEEFMRAALRDRLAHDVERMIADGVSEEDIDAFCELAIKSHEEAVRRSLFGKVLVENVGP